MTDQPAEPDESSSAEEPSPSEETLPSEETPSTVDTPESEEDRVSSSLRRRGLLVAGGAFVVVVVVVVTLLVVNGGDERRAPSGAMPTLGNQFASVPGSTPATESSESGEPESLPKYSGSPVWTVNPPFSSEDTDLPSIAVTNSGYVLAKDGQLWGLDRAGKQLWTTPPPTSDDTDVTVTPTTVFTSHANPDDDGWPGSEIIVARDVATGKVRWRDSRASFWSATTDTIYMSVCYGGQNNHIGDCDLSAHDPETNAVRWTVPTYASSNVANTGEFIALPTPPYLMIGGYPTGADSYSISMHDPDTGALLGRGYAGPDSDGDPIDSTSTRTVVSVSDSDENPADGCQATYTGYALYGGARTWSITGRINKRNDGRNCDEAPGSINDNRLAITTNKGRPAVVNADTGAIVWSAPTKGVGFAASATMLLAVESTPDEGQELVAYRIGTAKPRWRAPFVSGSEATATVTATRLIVWDTAVASYDLKTGKGRRYEHEDFTMVRMPGNRFAGCTVDACSGYRAG